LAGFPVSDFVAPGCSRSCFSMMPIWMKELKTSLKTMLNGKQTNQKRNMKLGFDSLSKFNKNNRLQRFLRMIQISNSTFS